MIFLVDVRDNADVDHIPKRNPEIPVIVRVVSTAGEVNMSATVDDDGILA